MKKLSMLLCLCMAFTLTLWSQASVQIIHNSPTPGTDSGPTVDIYVNGALLPELTAVPYRAATAYLDVPANTDIEVGVAVSPSTGTDDIIATFPLGQLVDGGVYTVMAAGIVGDAATPFSVYAGEGRTSASASDQVSIQAIHGATDAPAVDIDARYVTNLVSNLSFGGYSGYLDVAPGQYYLDVRGAGSPDVVATFDGNLNSLGGNALNVFASGLLGNTPAFGLFAALADGTVIELPATQVARLQLIHNSPNNGTGGGPTVDIYVNGNLYEDDFEFRTATEFRSVPAGVGLDVAVAPANSTSADDAIATFAGVTLEDFTTNIVTAYGIVGNTDTPFGLAVNSDAQEVASEGDVVALGAFHGSPDAPTVDVVARNIGTLIPSLEYGTYPDGEYLELPAGSYILDITAAGDPNIVASFRADISTLGGGAGMVFASGLLAGNPDFGLFVALPDGTVIELPAVSVANLQVIHNSPSPTVDVYVNGNLFLEAFEYLTATTFVEVPAGVELSLAVASSPSTSVDDAIYTTAVTLENGDNYYAVANGIVGDADFPFGIVATGGARISGTDDDVVDVRTFHGIPGAPAVDIFEFFDDETYYTNLAYGEFSPNYAGIFPGQNIFELRPTGTENAVGSFFTNLTGAGGLSGLAFAGGLLDADPAFNLYVALPNGQVLAMLPVAQAQIIHNSPAAAAASIDLYSAINPASNEDYTILEDDLNFRSATAYNFYNARLPLSFGVAPATSTSNADILFTLPPVTLETGNVYTIFANGIPGDLDFPFELVASSDSRTEAADDTQVDLVLFHGSPGAPTVDVKLQDGAVLFDDISYGEFSDYLGVAPADYVLDVTPGDDNETVVARYGADITTLVGQSATVFASGILAGDPNFQVWVALEDGTTFPLSEIVANNELTETLATYSIAPNPVKAMTTLTFELEETTQISLNFVNQDGRVLFSKQLGQLNSGIYREQLDLSSYPAGMYQLQLQSPDGQATQPVLIIN